MVAFSHSLSILRIHIDASPKKYPIPFGKQPAPIHRMAIYMSSHPSVSPPLPFSFHPLTYCPFVYRVSPRFGDCLAIFYHSAAISCNSKWVGHHEAKIRVTETKCDVFPQWLFRCGFSGGTFAFHPPPFSPPSSLDGGSSLFLETPSD